MKALETPEEKRARRMAKKVNNFISAYKRLTKGVTYVACHWFVAALPLVLW